MAQDEGWISVDAEVSKNTPFGPQMANLARRVLLQVAPRQTWTERARTAASTLKSFSLTVSPDGSLAAGLDLEPNWGRADSGSLNDDLADVFEAVGDAAAERGSGVVFLFDEVQFLSQIELEGLIGAVHRTVQRQLPITFAGAGLPQLPGLAGNAKSYAERLFKFPVIGELPADAAASALEEPALGRDRPHPATGTAQVTEPAPAEMREIVGQHVFPMLRTLGGEGSTYATHMKDARFTIPTPALLAKVVDGLGDIPMTDRDTKGDIYEYMLGNVDPSKAVSD